MRTKSAAQSAIIANPHHRTKAAVRIYDPAGSSYYDLGERVVGVEISEDLDGPRTANVRLFRQEGQLTIVPLIVAAGLAPFSTDPVTDVGRRIVITAQVQPVDFDVSAAAAITVFDGYVDEVAWPEDVMELVCTDKSAKLRDTWIERERAYCLCQGAYATKGAYVWRNDMPTLALGDLVIPSDAKRNGHFYRVTAASSAQGTTEPAWPTGSGSTIVSGGVTLTESGSTSAAGTAVETLIQQLIDDNGLSSIATLQTPVSPSWNVRPFLQDRMSVLDALHTLSDQLGWSLRFEWSSSLGRYELTLKAPDRSKTTADRTFTLADELEVSETRVDVFDIRNAVRVTFSDSSNLDPDGIPLRSYAEVTDAASITKYGRRFMEVQEASSSQIDSSSEAAQMANAILSDLAEPTAVVAYKTSCDPFIELGDLLSLPADNLRWSAATKLAVVKMTHSFDEAGSMTSVDLRGKPASRLRGWHRMDGRANGEDVHRYSTIQQDGPLSFNARDAVGGTRLTVEKSASGATKDAFQQWYEFHVSDTDGFTPDSSTLASTGQSNETTVSDLVPGKTYYSRIVPVTYNRDRIVRAPPSDQFSFVAGRAKAGHYSSTSTQSHLPLNGNFEHASDDITAFPPDHWELSTLPSESAETWGSSGSVYYGTDSSKGRFIRLQADASRRGSLISSPFEVRRGIRNFNIYLSVRRNGASAATGKDLIVDVWGFSDAALTSQIINYSVTFSGDASGPYPSLATWYDTVIDFGGGYGTIPSNVNFLQIRLRRGTTGDSSYSWDIGDVYTQEADFYRAIIDPTAWLSPTFTTGWGNYGAGFQGVEYRKDANGMIHLRGLATRSSGSSIVIFTLPSGYRPAAQRIFTSWTDGGGTPAAGRVDVKSNGNVEVTVGGVNYVSLEGISFDTQ